MSDFWSQAGAGNRSNGSRSIQKAVNLALQGGGSHGAFAWGVLDRLLEDGRITIDGISATSAGAMNAVTLAYGWVIGGPDGDCDRAEVTLSSGARLQMSREQHAWLIEGIIGGHASTPPPAGRCSNAVGNPV